MKRAAWLGVMCGFAVAAAGDGALVAQTSPPQPSASIRRNAALNFDVWPGDFNGDGIVDLAASQPWVDTPPHIIIALGKGDGTFGAPIDTHMVGRVLGVADFNKDGKADLLWEELPEDDPSVFVALGRGDGTFTLSSANMVAQPLFVYFGRVADVDGDGTPDVVLGMNTEGPNGNADGTLVVPGNGDGSFAREREVFIPMNGPLGGAVADLNGDGRADIAIANHDSHSITILLNQGALTFTSADMPLDREANDVAAADVNGDGHLDLLVAATRGCSDDLFSCDGYVYVLAGRGDGTFALPAQYQTDNGAWRIVVGDFNRDGVLDAATANRSAKKAQDFCGFLWDTISIVPGRGDGTFAAASSFALGAQSNLTDTRFRDSARSLAVADLNRDGAPDLVASWGATLINRPADPNWAPTVSVHATAPDANHTIQLAAVGDDVDQDALSYQWTDSGGQSIEPTPAPCPFTPTTLGVHTFTVAVDDHHGHTATSSVTVDFGGTGGGGPTITITAPRTAETVAGGVPYTIAWTTSPDIANDELLFTYSTDNGATWTHILECDYTIASKGQCTWNAPGPDSTQAFIRIVNRDSEVGPAGDTAGPFTIATQADALPSPWRHGDIGAVAAPGGAAYSNGIFTVGGSGADIWGGADEFHYVYQFVNGSAAGDFDLVTRVDSVEPVNAWTKAGLMARGSLDPSSLHASVFVTPGKGVAFQRRTVNGGTSVNTSVAGVTAPVWLRLRITNSRVDAYYKKNPTDAWIRIGAQTYSSPYPFGYAGLAITSHSDGTVAGANFSHVSFEPPQPTFGFTPIGTSVGDASEDFVAGTVTLSARGVDIWGTADQLMFANVAWSGDGQLMTQVRSLTNTSVWAKAGVMFRASTATGSAHVSVFVTPGKGVAMQYRGSTGATSVQAAQTTGVTAPLFLRLTRHGNTFTGEWSPDSFNWQTLSIITIPMPTGLLAGLAVTSHNTSATATALFADPTIR